MDLLAGGFKGSSAVKLGGLLLHLVAVIGRCEVNEAAAAECSPGGLRFCPCFCY